jgi:hypothetical protein
VGYVAPKNSTRNVYKILVGKYEESEIYRDERITLQRTLKESRV